MGGLGPEAPAILGRQCLGEMGEDGPVPGLDRLYKQLVTMELVSMEARTGGGGRRGRRMGIRQRSRRRK